MISTDIERNFSRYINLLRTSHQLFEIEILEKKIYGSMQRLIIHNIILISLHNFTQIEYLFFY